MEADEDTSVKDIAAKINHMSSSRFVFNDTV
jgi:hypothetical protein